VSPSSSHAVHQSGKDDLPTQVESELLAPLAALGLDLEAVEFTPAGKRSVLRIAVDKDEGITLDDVAEATRAISEVLDESLALGERPYTLEVTSRGVDRPLTLARHWRRNAGRLVKVSLIEGEDLFGRIITVEDGEATLDIEGETIRVAFGNVAKALVQIEFNPHREES
jgi:ribosome maturation factor RimP